MRCYWRHRWGRWIDTPVIVTRRACYSVDDKKYEAMGQERECIRCGIKQLRRIHG